MIYIIDFGSQTTHLIGRRLKDLGATQKIIEPQDAEGEIKQQKPAGIILSGGPASVYERNAPTISKSIFKHNIPMLGICYGFQLSAKLLGGKVVSGRKEYGPAFLNLNEYSSKVDILNKIKKTSTVWLSHGDEVINLPDGFQVIGTTPTVSSAFVYSPKNRIYGVQFHPEAEHTKEGNKILLNFLKICGTRTKKPQSLLSEIIDQIKTETKGCHVIGAVSGGVDSTVAGVLMARAIGKKFIPVYVENGLMRFGTAAHVKNIFKNFGTNPIIISCEKEMLKRLDGITDPEKKRTIIGNFYIEIFEREFEKLKKDINITHLMQGTIYSDVIESQGTKHSSKIKSHHNVGGLPKEMKLKLIEPVRLLYKDEVKKLGKKLGLSDEFINMQPFPGPGYAIRIRGEITKKRLNQQKLADKIILEELAKAKLLKKVFISFPVLTGAFSTAVKGDGRHFGEVIAVRIVESRDVMTSTWSRIPYDILQTISSRIVNEVPDISRVAYDITTKPPATMEWE